MICISKYCNKVDPFFDNTDSLQLQRYIIYTELGSLLLKKTSYILLVTFNKSNSLQLHINLSKEQLVIILHIGFSLNSSTISHQFVGKNHVKH